MADNGLHGVVGFPGSSDHFIPGMEIPQKGHSQGVGAGYELGTDQGGFRLEDIRINQVQLVPAHVRIAIAGGGLQVKIGHLELGKGIQHLFGVYQGCGFMAFGMLGNGVQCFPFDFIPLYIHWN